MGSLASTDEGETYWLLSLVGLTKGKCEDAEDTDEVDDEGVKGGCSEMGIE